MNALILVGGYGTRLRPLTLTTPKPLINFCNKPIIEHQILHLAKCGIKEIILAIAYKPTNITNFVKEMEKKYDVQIIFSIEDEPLGTGGPLKLAENYLNKYDDFFVFNSDIICTFPLIEMMNFHKQNKAPLTILVKEVEDPRAFGVVITEDKRITKFEEKPLVPKSSLINAGIYILNKQILNSIPQRNCSLEKEIFPKLANDNMLYFYQLNNFWADIGKPLDFLKGQSLYMENLEEKKYEKHMLIDHLLIYYSLNESHTKNVVHKNLFVSFENIEELNKFNENGENSFIKDIFLHTKIEGNVLISSTTIIKQNCVLGDNVVLGEHVIIGEGCRIKNSCVMSHSTISSYSYIENSIIGSKSRVGNWSRIEGLCVLGESVILKPEIFVNNVFILPFKEVNNSIYDKGAIIM
ncbi:putative mannose-1-phosphate guanyltransferase [Plasmodium gaboni]|uniref:mannose-1-phosphate guanylyltransferase n=1 Tax=Plasmodium gaboni TaxID=647221 RepID=A0A151LAA1_9APIC|nr:putative mannose-1-phosphate guanyltransferase [Plasmodium gaboni]KYN95817.1 putative mannose-1-phosphate guanyltransferase [Plasmodium gaboni]